MLGEGKMNIIRNAKALDLAVMKNTLKLRSCFSAQLHSVCSMTLNGVTFSYKNSERLSEYLASATVPTEQTSIIYTLHENGGSTNRISSTKEVNPITRKSAYVIISNTVKFQSVHPSLTAIRAFVSYYSGLCIQNLLFCVCLTNSSETWLYY